MSSPSDASSTDGLVDTGPPSSDELGVCDSDDDESHQDQEIDAPASLPERWHVLGLGQAMVISSLNLYFAISAFEILHIRMSENLVLPCHENLD